MCIVWFGYFYAKSLDIFCHNGGNPGNLLRNFWWNFKRFFIFEMNGEVCIVGGRIQVAKCKPPNMFDFEQIGEMIQSCYIF